MADFEDNHQNIADQIIILVIILIIKYYANIHYYKTPY